MLGSGMDHFNHTWLKRTLSRLCWRCWEVKSSSVSRRKRRRDLADIQQSLSQLALFVTIPPYTKHAYSLGEKTPIFLLTTVSVSKSRISRWCPDHSFRSRSDFSGSSSLWAKRQVTCLLSGQLIYQVDGMIMIKTLRAVPGPQQWWNPVWGDIARNPNPSKKMSW